MQQCSQCTKQPWRGSHSGSAIGRTSRVWHKKKTIRFCSCYKVKTSQFSKVLVATAFFESKLIGVISGFTWADIFLGTMNRNLSQQSHGVKWGPLIYTHTHITVARRHLLTLLCVTSLHSNLTVIADLDGRFKWATGWQQVRRRCLNTSFTLVRELFNCRKSYKLRPDFTSNFTLEVLNHCLAMASG